MAKPEKLCATCGRPMAWRRKWADHWDEVRHCSARCRGRRGAHRPLEVAILTALADRKPGRTVCPSEVARALGGGETEWRARMEPVREAGRRLAARGQLEWTQHGKVIDPGTVRGPVRFRLPRP